MATRIKQRRDTAQNWTSNNPILAAGETGWEIDTRMVKLGDGATAWNKLPYAVTGDLQIKNTTIASDSAVTLASGSGMQENWIAMVDGSEGVVSDRCSTYADAVAYDSQGNAFVVGYSYASEDTTDCWVIKTGPDGQVMWKNYYSQYVSYGYGVTVDHNDDIYLLMTEYDGVDGSDDVVLVKIYGVSGQIAWQKEFNSVGDYNDYSTSLSVDKDNNLFISGSTNEGGPVVFLVMKIAGQLQTIGQTSYQPGDIIWQKGFAGNAGSSISYSSNLTVDSNGDVGLIGNSYVGGPNAGYVPVVKISGVDGSIVWQTKIPQVVSDNGNYYYFGDITGSSIAADSQGNFYIALTNRNTSSGNSSNYYEVVIAKIPNVSSTGTVAVEWAKTIGYNDYEQASGSLICDSENNVYLTANLFDYSGNSSYLFSGRYALSVAKFSSGGSLIWQRNLAEEQNVTQPGYVDAGGPTFVYSSQSIAVNKDYVLMAGNSYHVSPFGGKGDGQSSWDTAFMAQVDKSGTEFEVNGWRFQDAKLPTKSVTVWLDNTNYFDPAAITNTTLSSVISYVVATENTDVVNVNYLNKSRTKTLTFNKNTLSVSPGGSIDVPREKAGYIGRVGNFDGPEGTNTTGDFYFNGVLNDDEGNTYAVGAWFNYNVYVGDNRYEKPAIIVKLDKDGNQLWMASSSMETYCQTVDIAINPVTKNLVVLNTDGDEGFNIYTINPVDGVMVGEPTHVRNADKYYAYGSRGNDNYYRSGDFESYGASNVWASSLAVLNDGTPVVAGYIGSERDEYQNVTRVLTGPSTSTNAGVLVVPHSTFNRGNLPEENGQWYVATTGTNQGHYYTGVAFVNRYGYGSSLTPVNVSVGNSTATGALFWIQIDPTSGTYSATKNNGGTNYTVNDTLKILGSQVGGADGTNDVLITVSTVDTTNTNAILTFTTTGTSNNTIVKLDVQSPYDFTIPDVYDVLEETGSDGFVWTPHWGLAIGNTTGTDYLNAIAVDSDNNIIVGGYYNNTGLRNSYNDNNSQNSILTKMSSTGTVAWTVSLDGYEGYGEIRGIVTDDDNNIYALANQNGWISVTKLDTDGNMFWYKLVDLGNDEDYSGTGIGIDSDRNIVVGGSFYNTNYTGGNSQGGNRYYAIIKLNTEGDVLFQRKLGTYLHNWNTGYDDVMVNSLSVGGDRISVIGYGYDNGNDQGLVASLPLDGTGSGLDGTEGGQTGFYGAFAYQNVEFDIRKDIDRSYSPSNNQYPVLPFTAQTRTLGFTTQYAYDTGTSITVYIDGPEGFPTQGQIGTRIDPVYEPTGGSITSVAHIVFEDGTVQNTAAGNIIPQTPLFIADQNYWYFIRPADAGRHIYKHYDNGGAGVVISTSVNAVLPIGTVITLVSGPNELSVDWYQDAYYNNTIEIWGVSPNHNDDYNQGWYLPTNSTAQLLKVEDNKWMLSCPVELGTGRGY